MFSLKIHLFFVASGFQIHFLDCTWNKKKEIQSESWRKEFFRSNKKVVDRIALENKKHLIKTQCNFKKISELTNQTHKERVDIFCRNRHINKTTELLCTCS